jgi:hypothetical protein
MTITYGSPNFHPRSSLDAAASELLVALSPDSSPHLVFSPAAARDAAEILAVLDDPDQSPQLITTSA